MESAQTTSLISIFSELNDPRIDRTKRHSLTDIITIIICAVVCGADSRVDVELFGKSRIARPASIFTGLSTPDKFPIAP